MAVAKPLVTDDLWREIEPLLPGYPVNPNGGGPRKPLRSVLTGIPWEDLPQEMGCGCGLTCWRYLED